MPPPRYKRTRWDYTKTDIQSIHNAIRGIDWKSRFMGLGPNEMADNFATTIYSMLSLNVPNKVLRFNDKDGPWVTAEAKTAERR